MLIKNHWFLCQYIMKWMLSYCKMGTLETLFQNCVVWSVNTNVLKEDMFLIEASLVYRPQTMRGVLFEQKSCPLLERIRYANRRALDKSQRAYLSNIPWISSTVPRQERLTVVSLITLKPGKDQTFLSN